MKYFYVSVMLLFLFSCNNVSTKQSTTVVTEATDAAVQRPLPKVTPALNTNSNYQIQNLQKAADYPSSFKDTSICKDWKLTEPQIRKILKLSEQIDGPTKHQYDHLPCVYKGVVVQKEHTYNLEINGGGWYRLTSKDGTLMYGSLNHQTKSFFLSQEIDNQ